MLYWKVIMPLTKFYSPTEVKTKFLYFIKNNKVFLINRKKIIKKSCHTLGDFIKKYPEPVIEAETPEEAIDILMILGK